MTYTVNGYIDGVSYQITVGDDARRCRRPVDWG
jgi:hypothetical protein